MYPGCWESALVGNLLIGCTCPSISNGFKEAAMFRKQTQDHGPCVAARCSQGCQVLMATTQNQHQILMSGLNRDSFHDNRIKGCESGVNVQYYSSSLSTLVFLTLNALLSL